MQFKDYYALFGVTRDASADDIEKAYRRLACKFQPDVSKEPNAVGRMSEINEANRGQRRAVRPAEACSLRRHRRRPP